MKKLIKVLFSCSVLMVVFAGVSFAKTTDNNLRLKNTNSLSKKQVVNKKQVVKKCRVVEEGIIECAEAVVANAEALAVVAYACVRYGIGSSGCNTALEMADAARKAMIKACNPFGISLEEGNAVRIVRFKSGQLRNNG